MPSRLSTDRIKEILKLHRQNQNVQQKMPDIKYCDVLIAGSGPIGAGFARTILEGCKNDDLSVLMCEIGAQDGPGLGAHQKNTIKYQKDIDAFVNVIKGALQKVSVPPSDTYIPTLGGDGWTPGLGQTLIFQGSNPNQDPRQNLKDFAVTRTVGGMATHWTCACPFPHEEERRENPIEKGELDGLLGRAHKLLHVREDQFDNSIRNTVVKEFLEKGLPKDRPAKDLPLAVERRKDNPDYVTWSATDTVFGHTFKDTRFELWQETRVTSIHQNERGGKEVDGVLVRRLTTNDDVLVLPRIVIVACGAVGTPQVLANSTELNIPGSLGHYLTEQSIAFCQIVLKREIISSIESDRRFAARVEEHKKAHPLDPLPIPFNDPDPQVTIPYSSEHPWHTQIHRDAFNYGDVGPRADSRVVVDFRFFGKQDINRNNMVYFGPKKRTNWLAGVTDMYGMPQATFEVTRSAEDNKRDQRMMRDMTDIANSIGAYLPGSEPQFMNPGLALHVTGTTRIGNDPNTSVADATSKVHGFDNLYVGGNNTIPDSTACNPTLTSLAIALKAADTIVKELNSKA